MLKSSFKQRGLYREKLLPEAKKRYMEKIAKIGHNDPFEIKNWSRNPDHLPHLTFPDIFTYLVCGVSAYTANQFKNYKSMEAHVQFTNGWIHDLDIFTPPDCEYVVVRTKVMHSQRLCEPPLTPWVMLSNTGTVECAHCTCMAGVAETCTHIGALLFKVEATVRIRGTKTVTDEPAYWILPGNLKKIHAEVGHKIDYSTSASQKKILDQNILAEVSTPVRRSRPQKRKIPPANLEDLDPLLDTLLEHAKAVGLSGMEKYYTLFTHTEEQSVKLPLSLSSLYNKNSHSDDLSTLLLCCEKYKNAAIVTDEQAEAIEKHTRLQHKCSAWYECRAGRITASSMHAVFATSLESPALTVVKQVCNPGNTMSTVQTKWGVNHEVDAQRAYIKLRACHKNLKVKKCGFIINTDFPELGASPDGLTTCDCCGNGCLEIKCPYKYRTSCIQEAVDANDKNFCLQLSGSELLPKKNHPYYTQVQTEIFVTKSNHCDLVVWTQKDMAVVRVFPDQEFWEPRLQKAQSFFKNICLPELVGRYFSEHTCTPASRET